MTMSQLLKRAEALMRAGHRDEALDAYLQATTSPADAATAWFNVGFLRRHRGEFEDALVAYARALSCGISAPEQVHLNRAAILSEKLFRDDDAEAELRAALALSPAYAPAWLNLGNLLEERGRLADAAATYARLIGIRDAGSDAAIHMQALSRLLELQQPTPDPALLARLRDDMHTVAMSASDRASLWFALGRIDDAAGRHADAFAAFEAANRLAHAAFPAYDPDAMEQLVKALMALPPMTPDATPPDPAFSPVFICGMFRSGSTLVEQMLAAHPDVRTCGELDLLPRLVKQQLAGYPYQHQALTAARASDLAGHYRRTIAARIPDVARARVVTDKRPDNFLLIGLILNLFPQARIVHTLRDPLDTGLSIFMQHINPRAFPYAGRLQDIGHYIRCQHMIMDHWKRRFPGAIHDVHYDRLVAAPEAELRTLLEFLDLDLGHEDRCLRFHELDNPVRTASHRQVRQPLHRGASGRWAHYRTQLEPLRNALDDDGAQPYAAGSA